MKYKIVRSISKILSTFKYTPESWPPHHAGCRHSCFPQAITIALLLHWPPAPTHVFHTAARVIFYKWNLYLVRFKSELFTLASEVHAWPSTLP